MLTGFSVALCAVMALNLAFPTAVVAGQEDHPEAPETIEGAIKVDAEGLIDAMGKMSDLIIVDARVAMDRKQGYIEGSVSLPDTDTDCETLSVIIPNLQTPALYYCNGPKCGRSVKSIQKALACGYTKLYWFRGGFEEWTRKNYPFLKE